MIVDMIDAYVDGRPMPRSSSSRMSEACVKRGGGCVKCCVADSASSAIFCPAERSGSVAAASSSSGASLPSSYTRRKPWKRSTWPVARKRPPAASMSTEVWSYTAGDIWLARKRFQISV